jgi:hypothetical protein
METAARSKPACNDGALALGPGGLVVCPFVLKASAGSVPCIRISNSCLEVGWGVMVA